MNDTWTSGAVTSSSPHDATNQFGDVDPRGDLVDLALARRARLRAQVGERSSLIDPDDQVAIALEIIEAGHEQDPGRHSIRTELYR